MNAYTELKGKQEAAFNEFTKSYMFFAFSKSQFAEGMKKLGLEPTDTDKILSTGAGGFIKKGDEDKLTEILKKHRDEKAAAIAADQSGDGYIYSMFYYELVNHEYSYTGSEDETLNALGFTLDEINADKRLLHGFKKALKAASKSGY